MRRIIAFLPALLVAASFVALTPSPAGAAAILVNEPNDELNNDGDCSLREAIVAANTDMARDACPAGSGADIVKIPSDTYALSLPPGGPDDGTDGDLDIVEDLTITGTGTRSTIIDGGQVDRVFQILPMTTVRISNLTIRNGQTADVNGAGAVWNIGGDLTLRWVTIASSDATAGSGGAIVSQNPAALLTVIDSTLRGNSTANDGGAVFNVNGATANLTNVTLSGNSADGSGGGAHNDTGSTMTIVGSTITKNTADADDSGGGGGGGIADTAGTLNIQNTIVAGNSDPSSDPDCSGTIGSMGYNVVQNAVSANCAFTSVGTDLTAVDPGLRPLSNNGGPTDTHALKPGSPARNRIPVASCGARDQRGAPRAGKCDAGAYEFVKCWGVVVNRVGTRGRDLLRGTGKRDGILALEGDDTVRAKAGNDSVCGGEGNDLIVGGGGKDKLDGDQDSDVLRGGGGRDTLRGKGGPDKLYGGAANDKLNGGPGFDLCRQGGGVGPVTNCET